MDLKSGSSVLEKQAAALKRMLTISTGSGTKSHAAAPEPSWKILVYDNAGKDIISPILSVRDLQDLGVTLHLNLLSERDAIPDVSAVYFVMPTSDNVRKICEDIRNQMYDTYHLNFISPIPRELLELIAGAAVDGNCVSQVAKVYDQYGNFISLDDDLYVLKKKANELSYFALNSNEIKDTEMSLLIDGIVDGLFSVFVTMGVVPIIRAPRNNAAAMVAERLDQKIRENLRDPRNNLFTAENAQHGQFSFHRPLLIVIDRNVDIATPLHHSWTYQALVHDILDYQLNCVTLDDAKPAEIIKNKRKPKSYDLGSRDKFWQTQKGSPFPAVAQAVQEELEKYKSSEEDVLRLKHEMGLDNETDETVFLLSDNTAKLTSAVTSLPELLERKKNINLHTELATALLERIKMRKLDILFEMEEKLMARRTTDESFVELLSDPLAGTPEDKMRLFLIAYVCGPTMSDALVKQCTDLLEKNGCDMLPFHYIRQWKTFSKVAVATQVQYGGGGTTSVQMFSKLMSQGSQFVMEGVKNFVVKKHDLPITRIVDALLERKSLPEVEDYQYLDPKAIRAPDPSTLAKNRQNFPEAFVFVVGGGSFVEYQNLVDYKNKSQSTAKRITYGCTELMNASIFLNQLSALGKQKH
ncbi:sec1 family domain-containing protein 1-like [Paramacrobiotus metropolitanus]|uniref:sec1 family domain-containing protein 1-like n=1 Tax=Paramacrobiotus metropolitanus TaxID=2943436 RepID=UPI0024455ED6|nr:sec1 family domain-containing protein 1-like [Paramacrobiotus metropolitanus]